MVFTAKAVFPIPIPRSSQPIVILCPRDFGMLKGKQISPEDSFVPLCWFWFWNTRPLCGDYVTSPRVEQKKDEGFWGMEIKLDTGKQFLERSRRQGIWVVSKEGDTGLHATFQLGGWRLDYNVRQKGL